MISQRACKKSRKSTPWERASERERDNLNVDSIGLINIRCGSILSQIQGARTRLNWVEPSAYFENPHHTKCCWMFVGYEYPKLTSELEIWEAKYKKWVVGGERQNVKGDCDDWWEGVHNILAHNNSTTALLGMWFTL